LPVLHACRQRTDAVISVETFRWGVARQALQAGADIISDSSGLLDQELARIIAESGAGLIIAHRPEPSTPVLRSNDAATVSDLAISLRERAELAVALGIHQDQIFIDPGLDLHRNKYHSLQLIARLEEITSIGYPLFVSASKPFKNGRHGQPKDGSAAGAMAAIVVCILLGARLIRVHDIDSAIAVVRTTEAILGWRAPLAPKHNLI
jgi:dihydropteroate synthase